MLYHEKKNVQKNSNIQRKLADCWLIVYVKKDLVVNGDSKDIQRLQRTETIRARSMCGVPLTTSKNYSKCFSLDVLSVNTV